MPRKKATNEAASTPIGGAATGGGPLAGGSLLAKCYYLVTIKCNYKVAVTKAEMDEQLRILVKKCTNMEWSDKVCYEEDSCNRIHLHTTCILTGPKPYFKKLMVKGWHIDFTEYPQPDESKILSYINKHNQSENAIKQLFDINPYKISYMFS